MQQSQRLVIVFVTDDHHREGLGLLHRLRNRMTMVRAWLRLDSGYIEWN